MKTERNGIFKHFSICHWLNKKVIVGLNKPLLRLTVFPKRTTTAQFNIIHKLPFFVFKLVDHWPKSVTVPLTCFFFSDLRAALSALSLLVMSALVTSVVHWI